MSLASDFVLATSFQESFNSNEILLKSRQFTPNHGLSIQQISKTHFLIQLEHIPSKEERKALENEGIKLLDYIPDFVRGNSFLSSFAYLS